MAVRYGFQLYPDACDNSWTETLKTVLSKFKYSCGSGFDWFIATIFLIHKGDEKRTIAFLERFSECSLSSYTWSLLGKMRSEVIPPVYSVCCHFVETIVEEELPMLFSAFKLSGCTVSQICQQWLRECFWNVLNFSEIAHFVMSSLILGPDYPVYFCVSVLRHATPMIMQGLVDQSLVRVLSNGLQMGDGYRLGNHLEFMNQLELKYRARVLSDWHQE